MTGQLAERWRLALVGAAAGAALWAVIEIAEREILGDRLSLTLMLFIVAGGAALLAMAGPIGLARALPRAFGLAALVAGLCWLAGLRHATASGMFISPLSSLSLITVATLPVPFLIGEARGNWRDYGALFLDAWSIVVRYAAALAFTGVVWLVIFLSDEVLGIVGVTVISDLLDHWIVGMVLTGAALGLGMAVVYEHAELLSPYLVLRLFRLLLPAVLVVTLVFLAALPFQGLDGVFDGLSPAFLLLSMVAAGVSLVSITVDQSDAEAPQSPALRRAAQGMALLLPVLAALAAWAIWLRVGQHGWTPERLFVALIAGVGLLYGLLYAVAVLRGQGWMERIRRGNVGMALFAIGLAAVWLTPLLNAERIAATTQLARFEAGQTTVDELDVAAFENWGLPGAAALARLDELSRAPGQEALAARLADRSGTGGLPPTVEEVAALMPVQPPSASATRDALLAAAEDYQRAEWARQCRRPAKDGGPGCLMVVADLLPAQTGDEAILFLAAEGEYGDAIGLFIEANGTLATRATQRAGGGYLPSNEAGALLQAWRDGLPPVSPAPVNQLGTGSSAVMFLP